jgi:hypothetical protein
MPAELPAMGRKGDGGVRRDGSRYARRDQQLIENGGGRRVPALPAEGHCHEPPVRGRHARPHTHRGSGMGTERSGDQLGLATTNGTLVGT